MLKERLRVNQAAKELGVSRTIVYRRLKQFRHMLKGMVIKEKGVTFITTEGLQVLKGTGITYSPKMDKEETFNIKNTPVENKFKVFKDMFEQQIEQLKCQLERKDKELDRKDNLLNNLISNSSKERERTDTIIMKLTQDLEKIRNENQLLLESAKKSKEQEKENPKKKDPVISIEEYINKKLEEDKEKSNFEFEKKRLKNQYSNPLQGKSKLYQLYIKLFHPEKLRREA